MAWVYATATGATAKTTAVAVVPVNAVVISVRMKRI